MIKFTDKFMNVIYNTREAAEASNIRYAIDVIHDITYDTGIESIKRSAQSLVDACNGIGAYEVEIKNTLVQEIFTNPNKYSTYTKSNPDLTIIDEIPPIEPKNNLKEDLTLVDDSCLTEPITEVKPTGLHVRPCTPTESDKPITDISTTVNDWSGIPAKSDKSITDINIGQEIDVEVDKGDSIITKEPAVSKFNVGDEVIILSVDRTAFTPDTIGKKGVVTDIIGLINVKVDNKTQYFTSDQLEKVISDVEAGFKVGDRVEVITCNSTPYYTKDYKGIKGTIINICSAMRPIAIKVGDAEYYFHAYNLKKL